MSHRKKSENVPKNMEDRFREITDLTDVVCEFHLNDEYAQLARYAAAALARKRPSPLLRGHANSWACGIVYALGFVNFLSDPSFEPSMTMAELCEKFGVSKATGYNKSREVRNHLQLIQMDPEWTLPSLMADNPFIRLLTDNPLTQLLDMDTPLVDSEAFSREVRKMLSEMGLESLSPEEIEEAVSPSSNRQLSERGHKGKKPLGKKKKQKRSYDSTARCSLCGKGGKLIKTPCCGQWICDDEDQYQLFSFARNSCFRNHDRYTLCAFHFHERHAGPWTDCKKCRNEFETEMYVWYGTNEYNFTKLKNPPEYEPTRCSECNTVIVLGEGGYSARGKTYYCSQCTEAKFSDL